jgi:hypothetical protein
LSCESKAVTSEGRTKVNKWHTPTLWWLFISFEHCYHLISSIQSPVPLRRLALGPRQRSVWASKPVQSFSHKYWTYHARHWARYEEEYKDKWVHNCNMNTRETARSILGWRPYWAASGDHVSKNQGLGR